MHLIRNEYIIEIMHLITNDYIIKNKHKICAKVRNIIQSQDLLNQFLKVKQYLKVSISFLTSPDHS